MTTTTVYALAPGTKLQNYRIERVLGKGGFGITYLAHDEALNQQVAIKEFFPTSIATRDAATSAVHAHSDDSLEVFKWGLQRFLEEARILARLSHPNIVRVLYFMASNSTGYMVMAYEKGQPLQKWVQERSLGQADVEALLDPITDALATVHKLGIAHRDIKPENVIMRADGTPVILDFGAARNIVSGNSQTMAAIVSAGYSPIEQYSDISNQGPWTDVYATAAVAYWLITGSKPPDAPARIDAEYSDAADPCLKLADAGLAGYDTGFLAAIDRGLALRAAARPKTMEDWRGLLFGADRAETQFFVGDLEVTEPLPGGGVPPLPDELAQHHATVPTIAAPASRQAAAREAAKGGGRAPLVLAGIGALVALGAAGYFFANPTRDRVGDTFEAGFDIGALGRSEEILNERVGGGDPADVVRFRLGEASLVTVTPAAPGGGDVTVRLIDATGAESLPLVDADRLVWQAGPGTFGLKFASGGALETAYTARYAAEPLEAGELMSGSSRERAIPVAVSGLATPTLDGRLWTKGSERFYRLDIEKPTALDLNVSTKSGEAGLALTDEKGLSVGRSVTAGTTLLADLKPGRYFAVVTSRSDAPIAYALETALADRIIEAKLAEPVVTDSKSFAEPPARDRDGKADTFEVSVDVARVPDTPEDVFQERARNAARAALVAKSAGKAAASGAMQAFDFLETGVPYDEIWRLKSDGDGAARAELSAKVRGLSAEPGLSAGLTSTSVDAFEKFDVTLSAEREVAVGVFGWGADGSVVRIYPETASSRGLVLSGGARRRLEEFSHRKLISAPLDGETQSREAIVVTSCRNIDADFGALAPMAGESDTDATLAKAIRASSFLDRLARFCPETLAVRVLGYTVSAAR